MISGKYMVNMQEFREILQKQFNLSDSDWDITKEYFKIEVLESKQFFVKEGQIANKLGFVKEGLLRSYSLDHEVREATLQFFKRGTVVIIPYSFNEGIPARENIIKIAPLSHIASFLGIDIATLSRLRKKNRLD